MPRRLPWASKGTTSRARVQPTSSSPAAASRMSINENDFFEETVSATGNGGSGQASDSDDGLPNLLAEPPILHARSKTGDAYTKRREKSSSPPPLAEDLKQPRTERMHKGISKFDLRDDEWMMVEDEFLETAKIFTRHLHIAEYERLKGIIEEKKKVAVSRPVVANAKMSAIGTMKNKTQSQEQQQKKAIRDVFTSQDDEEGNRQTTSSASMTCNKTMPLSYITKRPQVGTPRTKPQAVPDSDSDDLDTLRHPEKPRLKAIATSSPKVNNAASGSKGAPSTTPIISVSPSTFARPAPPQVTSKARSRISRATPFDMLDDWVPKRSQQSSKAAPEQPIEPLVAPSTPAPKSSRSFDSFDSAKHCMYPRSKSVFSGMKEQRKGSEVSGRSEDLEERLAKRRADREQDDREKKRKTLDADDIPTFLF